MPLRKLIRALRGMKASSSRPDEVVPKRAGPPRPAAPPPPEPLWIELEQLAAAWTKASSRLGVRSHSQVKPGEAVRVRITSKATALDLTLEATAGAVSRDGAGWLVSADVGQEGAALVERLLGVLRGEADPIVHRKPRYRLSLPAVITSGAGKIFMSTVSVSLDGCGLAWSGPVPRTGSGIFVQLGSGSRAVSFRAMTCWSHETPRGTRVGVRFVAGDRNAWTELLAQLSKDAERS